MKYKDIYVYSYFIVIFLQLKNKKFKCNEQGQNLASKYNFNVFHKSVKILNIDMIVCIIYISYLHTGMCT